MITNLKGVRSYFRENLRVLEIKMNEANYQGIPWNKCSEFQKRKFENFVFLSNNRQGMEYKIKIVYI